MQGHTAGSGRLWLVLTALLFSTGGAAIKGTALNAWQVAGLRSLVAASALILLLPDARRGWRLRWLPVAAAYAATLITFVTATKLTTAANAIYIQSAAPVLMLLLSPVLLKERVRRADLIMIALVAGGMALLFTSTERASATAPDPARGNLVACLSAVAWAFTISGLRWINRGTSGGSGTAVIAMGNLLTAACALPLAWPILQLTARDGAVLLWLGVFQIGLAYFCMTRGLREVPALEAATILLLEPALNPVWAWLVHGEVPSGGAVAGGAVILAATAGSTWWHNRVSAG